MVHDKSVVLRFAKLTENAFAPSKGSALAAGYDLKRFGTFSFHLPLGVVNY